jgi:hypothetical protein
MTELSTKNKEDVRVLLTSLYHEHKQGMTVTIPDLNGKGRSNQ